MSDEEITRWLAMYRRRRALAHEEITESVRAETTAFLDLLIAQATHEQHRRVRAGDQPTPARFTSAFIDDLKRRIALDEMCEYELGAKLGRLVGGKRQGPCPICKAGHNCFTVYLADAGDQHYHCFRCGAGGDAISIIMQAYHDTFPEAVERLCKFGHLDVPPAPATAVPKPKPATRRSNRVVIAPRQGA